MKAGIEVTDYDFATNAPPQEVMRLFKRVIPTGIQHGTVTVLFRGRSFEVTTYRVESGYSDFRRPDSIDFTPSIEEDLKRRDFTVNALALNLSTGSLLDPHGGLDDLKKGIIRAIGNPLERFNEDPLRMVRACRFSAQLGFTVEAETLRAIEEASEKIDLVSIERIRDEFIKIVLSSAPSQGISLMDRTSLLTSVVPELEACKGVTQKGRHVYDVYEHSLKACAFAAPQIVIRLAALFHDIGKPATKVISGDGTAAFHRHEEASERIARGILQRMKFPRSIENRVCHLILHHMFDYHEEWSDAAVRRFISRVGPDYIHDLFLLRCADSRGIKGIETDCPKLLEFGRRIDKVIAEENTLSVKGLDVDGNILADEAGIPRGPAMGRVLNFLLESVIDDPALNRREKLVEIAHNFYRDYIQPKRGHG